ncbi:MAG TPA: hypothetical protein GXX75_04020 [Clostridiales bacterium]|nr:hypothetical protein [Clostridiales bacterium]
MIQTRHVVDEFQKSIKEYVVSRSPYNVYDITEVPLEEAAKNIKSLVNGVRKAINEYEVSSESSDVIITIVYHGKKSKMTFGNQSEGSIQDRLVNELGK